MLSILTLRSRDLDRLHGQLREARVELNNQIGYKKASTDPVRIQHTNIAIFDAHLEYTRLLAEQAKIQRNVTNLRRMIGQIDIEEHIQNIISEHTV
jgi:thermostable 8-oxoguanine DNA glycosylase